jgi:ribosomal-protein-alanine N-acetyltransferase
MPQPPRSFVTARTFLRPVAADDAHAIFEGYSSSLAAMRFMSFARQQEVSEAALFATCCAQCWEDGSAYPWAVIVKATGDFIGVVELRINPPNAELGYMFAEQFWGQGFGTEAAQAVVSWAWAQPEVLRVWATCHPDNAASARVLEKLGLLCEARVETGVARLPLGEQTGPYVVFSKLRQASQIRG